MFLWDIVLHTLSIISHLQGKTLQNMTASEELRGAIKIARKHNPGPQALRVFPVYFRFGLHCRFLFLFAVAFLFAFRFFLFVCFNLLFLFCLRFFFNLHIHFFFVIARVFFFICVFFFVCV